MTPAVIAGLERALQYSGGTHTLADVLRAITAGDAQLHQAPGATIITEICTYPQTRELNIWLATGEKAAVIELSKSVMRWAKETWGCKTAVFVGRKGWAPVLAKEGWSEAPVTLMRREI